MIMLSVVWDKVGHYNPSPSLPEQSPNYNVVMLNQAIQSTRQQLGMLTMRFIHKLMS